MGLSGAVDTDVRTPIERTWVQEALFVLFLMLHRAEHTADCRHGGRAPLALWLGQCFWAEVRLNGGEFPLVGAQSFL